MENAVIGPGSSSPNGPNSKDAFSADPMLILEYIANILRILLGAEQEDLESFGSLLSEDLRQHTLQLCSRFAHENHPAIYVMKEVSTSTVLDGVIDLSRRQEKYAVDEIIADSNLDSTHYKYKLASSISFTPSTVASLAILKRPYPIDSSQPLYTQIQTIPFTNTGLENAARGQISSTVSPFEALHSVLHLALAPYFDAYTKSKNITNGTHSRSDVEAKTGIPITKKRMAELELSLLHLQQNVEIPELILPLHPIVQSAIDEAAVQGIKATPELIPLHTIQDSTFLNSLQSLVNGWIKSIQGITKMSRDPASGSATQEINFWLNMESALERIGTQLSGEGVRLTIEILKIAKRYQATVSFRIDTGLNEASDKVQKYNQLMRDFPLDELLSATSLSKVQDALNQIFAHLNKKLRICPYPIRRALPLVEAISSDLNSQLHSLLHGRSLMHIDYREFKNLMVTTENIWKVWDENVKEFTNVAREVTRRRNEKFIPIKINPKHAELQARLKYVSIFRENHEQLQKTIVSVLGAKVGESKNASNETVLIEEMGDVDAVDEVQQAYAALNNVDLLDVTPEGTRIWVQAEITYNERTSRVENSIIARLRDRLATAKTSNEMFRVFSKFNALFVRPKIRGAITEYQTQLIDNVKRDISSLHERFKQQYGHSESHAMAQLRDLPPISGAIIWARQIERQLDGYMKRVEDVLGHDWAFHSEGQKLQSESNLFRKKLDTRPIFEAWLHDVQVKQVSISGRLFNINKIRSANNLLELSVNFDPQIIALFKETRNLLWLNFAVPHSINNISKEAKRVYPFAVSLMETTRTFAQISRKITQMADVSILLSGYINDVHRYIAKGTLLKWESFVNAFDLHIKQSTYLSTGAIESALSNRNESKHVQFIREFATSVSLLQVKTDTLASINITIQKSLAELETCSYDSISFKQRLDSIQMAVDQLSLENYVNLGYSVKGMNSRIKRALLARLRQSIAIWTDVFENKPQKGVDDDSRRRNLSDSSSSDSRAPTLKRLVHEISMRNQVIYLDPPLDYARASWFSQLHEWIGIVCNLRKIKASRYQMTLSDSNDTEARFVDLPGSCTESLLQVYTAIEKKIVEIGVYVDKWLQFQSLWDLQSEQVYEILGETLSDWLQLLQEIRKARSTFDTSELSKSFGHLVVDYEQVQTKVNAKYDQWQHEIVTKFAARLGLRAREVYSEIEKARKDLEIQSLEATSTAQAVQFITIVQTYKRKIKLWGPEINIFRQGQTMLMRQRYQFTTDWLDVEQIDSEWAAFNEILSRKSKIVQDQTDALRAKILAEDRVVNEKIVEITNQWNEEKPVSGTISPNVASVTLMSFETRISKLHEEASMVSRAKEALDLPSSPESFLASILEEVHDFKSVWSALSTIWKSLNDLRDMLWNSVQPRKLRSAIDNLIKMTKEMPSRMRQYAAFEHIQNVLRQLLKVNPIVADLKSEAIRDRHWQKIYKSLKPGKRHSSISMTLGDVWDINLSASEIIIKDIIAQAQGEMALEEFLRQVREVWTNYPLELVNYQNKCRLIRGWDDLFAKCSENLNSLQAMKHSPYCKEFEEEASSWEDKLNRVHVLFDVWIDVQRQWVYLEGVFTGNADIKHLLPIESSRFQNINSEFFALMKKVCKQPFVLDVLNISGVQKSLERLAELLNKIQKALGEYLERERVSFPRFYFVGDEDLLEIIGNSNDTLRIAKHLKKMFAGLSGLIIHEDHIISGFTSKEGEEVKLRKEISLVKVPKINDWLALLESGMKSTLAELLAEAIDMYGPIFSADEIDKAAFSDYIATYPSQITILATQAVWTSEVEKALEADGSKLQNLYHQEVKVLQLLAATVLGDICLIRRKICEQLITECVHQRDVIDRLITLNANTKNHYFWLLQMRYSFTHQDANAKLNYGFEYLGVTERLVRTPLTDRCFLTLTQALCQRLGGSPYGPAGTGKTESVKALGVQLGRFTLVFCCDDTFDFQSMGRIFLGICQVGAWGCFDEFNRLEERILSAVSQQVQNIQLGLKKGIQDAKSQIELIGRQIKVDMNTGIFITLNPGYAGRSNLPDNLKKLFRSVAMSKPDKELIAEVMLYSQGFTQAKNLSKQAVPFFEKCSAMLSRQAHYDFGLRALKSVLVSSGSLKRARLILQTKAETEDEFEPQIIVQSIRETIAPKLIKSDVEIMQSIEAESFPGVNYHPASLEELKGVICSIAQERDLIVNENWMLKILQLYQIQMIHHGVMMVGDSGTGKSVSWKILLQALQKVEGIEGICHIIDPKVMSKEALYGNLDSTTREWTDGLFTSILRKIIDNLRGEEARRHWIIFDGDVDPEWVENLNSVLDDNKILTLPNGERLNLPANVRIMFEVETLKYATLATVSRCGMVWFNEDNITPSMLVTNYLDGLRSAAFEDLDEDTVTTGQTAAKALAIQRHIADLLHVFLTTDNFITLALDYAKNCNHIMEFTVARVLSTLFSLLNKVIRNIIEYNNQHIDFPLDPDQVESYVAKKLLLALIWSLTGDCPRGDSKAFGDYLSGFVTFGSPIIGVDSSIIDYDVTLPLAEWSAWQNQVPTIELNTHSITQTDVVIPTLDTVRHEDVLYSWLAEHKPLILCGPPGSGKTMTLFSALRKLPNMEVVGLNFSSATTPDLLIKTLDQYCEYRKTLNGVILSPTQIGRWLILFCDEINLPAPDKYGTQRAISFLRQLIDQNGFWRTCDKSWVTLERIQFVGACNPPTDAGRTALGARFLRHAPLLMVDYPGQLSLHQIYGTFMSAILKIIPSLRGYSEPLTKAMVQFYLESQERFTPKIQPHYIYSPRELTRWVRGIYEAIRPLETLTIESLIRIWAHEALRLFQDRLVSETEREWTSEAVHRISREFFPSIDESKVLSGPILFSNWLSKNYVPVDREQLREFVKARLKTFCEEEVDVSLVLFNDVLDHVLRIDRVFRQPQGHLILIGVSGSGKTTLSRFVAWMNGLKVFQIKIHGKYSSEDFDDDLRDVLRRSGCKGEKICFIMDESNVLDSGFLERMNTLLANAEVPGLFEGDEFAALMTACKEGAQRQGLLLDSQEELYRWFTQQIIQNLHIVFTMNPPEEGLSSKAATSPALFNRCVLNWFGDWSDQALFQVGMELTQSIDLDRPNFIAPDSIPVAYRELNLPASHRDTFINSMVYIHLSLHRFNTKLLKYQGRVTYLTPRHFLDFVAQFVKLYEEKREDLEEQQRHLNVGLEKLRDTVDKVRDLRISLAEKKDELQQKNEEANEKLQRMLCDQKEAESRKAISLEIQVALEKQETEVAERREIVLNDLAKAEPAVQEAAKSVQNIKRQHLTELRSMSNPPQGVKLALDAVCTLLGHKVDNWKAVQAVVRRDDFIANIVLYKNDEKMTKGLRIKMRNDYLSNDDFTFEKVNRASKACGPLVQWVQAQVEYSEILDRVGPLRHEVTLLEEQALDTKARAKSVEDTLKKLGESIATYKIEYAALISQIEAIKNEMARVQFKVDRSVRLLESLSSERIRWENSSKSFETQIATLVGDVLVAAAFLAYSGLYDQQFRKNMMDDWLNQLQLSGIFYKQYNPMTEYLSTADERLGWHENSLPVDDLCTENAIILKRFNRYPLIIDPSGRVIEFIQREIKEKSLTITSFLDDSFVKQLESSLRFGNPILIQDAEYLDPVLNHVLNKEYQKTGGRVLIQLGKQQIDFSTAFKIYLSTRDPSAIFPPDVCSRTTLVNFTVTQSSLQTQSLNEVLKSERPDVDERRSNLIKLQGEFKVHLRQLEKQLLQALNESRGNILDDDNVIETLENLKKEAADISIKMSNTEGVMADVDEITLQYNIIARSCSAVFDILEHLHYLNNFYQFSLQYFLDIFHLVLHDNKRLANETNHNIRRDIIIEDLFIVTYHRTSLGLLQKDKITLAMLLAQAAPFKINKSLLDVILDESIEGTDVSTLTMKKDEVLQRALNLPILKDKLAQVPMASWDRFISEELGENYVPVIWEPTTEKLDQELYSLLLIKLFRLDRFVPAAENFVTAVFGSRLFDTVEDLKQIVDQVSANTPILLCSSPGFDASYKIENLVSRTHTACTNIAMGSNEGLASADKAVASAASNGSWVLVKNVHLAPTWLQSLEKRMGALKPHTNFRLFLSMETSPKIPINFLRASRVLMYEQPAGVRANMKDSMLALSSRAKKDPVERNRLYLLLSFLHAIIQERLRYAPNLGWSGFWEFNDSDYECCAFIIDTWVEKVAFSRTNIAPHKLPWDMIRILIIETYGGKIDNENDFNQLSHLVNSVFNPAAFEDGHSLIDGLTSSSDFNDKALVVPTGTSFNDFNDWIQKLPEREPPMYLGLPANAEKLLLVDQGISMIHNLAKISDMLDEGEKSISE
ncbi:cytoplasmic dynein-like protein 1 heavy chain 1 [Erysiphe pulchra]|uniref:Dynein heavy chain, cytoplasmic n=1 Tax=Erysiphe pulchra TaxID=225359 RepID=A0A2S4PZ05_9PEZI|nr:cytoplasmic dynein-like protein 1 heavy chain 1 [Erysiphe pulchra]